MMTLQTLQPSQLLAAGLLCLWLAGCGGPTEGPEAALREWVSRGHERAEDKDRRGLVDMISPDYVDARGNSRDDISDLFRIYFLRTHTVALITRIDELNVYGDDAGEVVLTVNGCLHQRAGASSEEICNSPWGTTHEKGSIRGCDRSNILYPDGLC
jgi:hypothetical protein